MDDKHASNVARWYARLQAIFAMKEASDFTLRTWAEALDGCNNDIMQQAITQWLREQSKAPKPADLLELYKQISRSEQLELQNKNIGGVETVSCPYCRDTGFFKIVGDTGDEPWAGMMRCEHDPKSGALGKMLDRADWKFVPWYCEFVRNRDWIGEDMNIGKASF